MKRLWFKIFFVLISANIFLAALLYWGFNWTFELAFKRYLIEQERERFQPFISALVDEYQARGNWDWIHTDHQRWRILLREYILQGERPDLFGPVNGGAPQRPAEPSTGNGGRSPLPRPEVANSPIQPRLDVQTNSGLNPHILLYDQNGRSIIGNTQNPGEVYRFAVLMGQEKIATIGVRAQTTLLNAMQAVVSNQSNDRLVLVMIGLLLVSSFIAFWLATWLTLRIYRIKIGTTALVRGQYDYRIKLQSKDALGKLVSDFNLLAETLERNQESHRQWIANTSHELRTPVTILAGEIDALRDGIRQPSDKYLDSLSVDIMRLNRLIDDLHQLSMSDIGALNYQKDVIDFVDFIDDELIKLANLMPQYLHLSWQKPSQNYRIIGDGNRLAQLMENLVQNSIRYTETPGKLSVSLSVKDNLLVLLWQDSAPGVEIKNLERLIQPLFRAEHSRSRKVAGSGLGLAIAHSIVQAHGGTMTAHPSELGGLKWQIEFPMIK